MAARCQLEIRGKLSSRRSTPLHPAAPGPMHLRRTIPGIGGLPQLRVYSCQYCGGSLTEADDPPDETA